MESLKELEKFLAERGIYRKQKNFPQNVLLSGNKE